MQETLLQVGTTLIDSDLPTPAELLLGRPITTLLRSRADPGRLEHRECLEKRTTLIKKNIMISAAVETYHHFSMDRVYECWTRKGEHGTHGLLCKNAASQKATWFKHQMET